MTRQKLITEIEVNADAAAADLKKLGKSADGAAVDIEQLTRELKSADRASKDTSQSVRKGADDIERSGNKIGNVYDKTGDSALGAASAIGEAFGEGGSAASAMGSMGEVVESIGGMFGPLGLAVAGVGGALIGAFSQAAAKAEELRQKTSEYFAALVEGSGQLDKALKLEKWQAFVEENQELAQTVSDLLGPQGLHDLADAVGGNTSKIGEMSSALDRNRRILEDERTALQVTRIEQGALNAKQAERLAVIEDSIAAIDDLKGKLGDESGAVRKATDQWNLYKQGIEAATSAKGKHSAAVPHKAPGITVRPGEVVTLPGKNRAAGGPVTAGLPYVVGEYGRETFIPSTDGTIVPDTGRAAVTDLHVHLHAPVMTPSVVRESAPVIGRAIADAHRRGGAPSVRTVYKGVRA